MATTANKISAVIILFFQHLCRKRQQAFVNKKICAKCKKNFETVEAIYTIDVNKKWVAYWPPLIYSHYDEINLRKENVCIL